MDHSYEEHLIGVIRCLSEMSGQQDCLITEDTNPLKDLGLDSCDGLDFACQLEERYGITIPDQINPFVDDEHKRPRHVREIAVLIRTLATAQEASHAGS